MLLPIMDFVMFFVPAGGFLIGIILLCIRPLRFLAPFAFLVPLLASYGAIAGFWCAGIGLERLGIPTGITGMGAQLGFFVGGITGGILGLGGGLTINRMARRLRSGTAQSRGVR